MKATKNTKRLLKIDTALSIIDNRISKYERLVKTNYNPIKYAKMQDEQRKLSKLSFETYESLTTEEKEYLFFEFGEVYNID